MVETEHMRRVLIQIALSLGVAAGMAQAQPLTDQISFRSGQLGGIRLYGVSVFSGYASTIYPVSLGQAPSPATQNLGGSGNYGASASLGWQRHRGQTNISVLYSGTYDAVVRYSNLNAFGHMLGLGYGHGFGRRWSFQINGSAQDATMYQALNQPTGLTVLSQLPTTFDDLAAAFAVGKFSDGQIAAMMTGSPLMAAPARSLLFGNRVLSYSGQAGASYAHSQRLTFRFSAFTAAGQTRRGGGNSGLPEEKQVMPRSAGFSGGGAFDYSLSPRTQLGFGADANYVVNKYQRAQITTTSASLGRKMGMRWFLSLHGGVSFTRSLESTGGPPRTRNLIGGGSIGFRTYQHTLVATYERTAFDTFGFAVGENTNLAGSWGWRLPGRSWSVNASGGQQQLRRSGFASLTGWQSSAGFSRRMSTTISMNVGYAMFWSAGTYLGALNDVSSHSVRFSLNWTPPGANR